MTKQSSHLHLTELTLGSFLLDEADPAYPLANERFKVTSICRAASAESAEVWAQIAALKSKMHRRAATAAIRTFVKIAQAGQPLTELLDKKSVHETHAFHSQVSGKTERIWRYRRGDVRVLFYDARDRIILLSGVLIKLKDHLTVGELRAAEREVDQFLKAQQQKLLRWV